MESTFLPLVYHILSFVPQPISSNLNIPKFCSLFLSLFYFIPQIITVIISQSIVVTLTISLIFYLDHRVRSVKNLDPSVYPNVLAKLHGIIFPLPLDIIEIQIIGGKTHKLHDQHKNLTDIIYVSYFRQYLQKQIGQNFFLNLNWVVAFNEREKKFHQCQENQPLKFPETTNKPLKESSRSWNTKLSWSCNKAC